MSDLPKPIDDLTEGTPEELQRDVAEALEAERAAFADPKKDGAHGSFRHEEPTLEDIERVWREFWLPSLRDGEDGSVSLEKLKGELYDCHHLIMAVPKVYRHVTGGLTDDPTASPEAIIRLAEKQFHDRLARIREGQPDRSQADILARIRERKRDAVVEAARAFVAAPEDQDREEHDALESALNELEG